MIKEHPFTTLCDILRSGNDEVMNIFNQYAVRKNTPVQPPPRFRELILTTKPIMKDDAKERIKTLIAKISECGDNYFAVFQEMSNVLTADGIGKILALMGKDKIDEFLDGEDIQYLFKGMPIFKVMIEDRPNIDGTLTQGQYDISIIHTGTNNKTFVKFETVMAKALYIFFLLLPREKVYNLADKVINGKKDKKKIRPIIKDIVDTFFLIIGKSDQVDKDFLNDMVFEKKLNQAVSSIKRSMEKALNGRDILDWYVVDIDRSNGYHSLSLPGEMIIMPQSLAAFKEERRKQFDDITASAPQKILGN